MNPLVIGLAGIAVYFLFTRSAKAETTGADIASGAADPGASHRQVGAEGDVAYGTYEPGQKVQARLAHPFGYFFGKPPWTGPYPVLLPIGSGPNAGEWQAVPGQSSPGRGITGNHGEASEPRYRQLVPTLHGHNPFFLPKQPRLHTLSRRGAIPDGPTNPKGQTAPVPSGIQTPSSKSLPGVLYRDADGGIHPLVDSWYTVNFSGVGLQQGSGNFDRRSADDVRFRLFIGARYYSAAFKGLDGDWYHLPFGEMKARLAFRHPAKGRFPIARDMRASPTGADPWRTGVFGSWLVGSETNNPPRSCIDGPPGACNPVITPGQERVPYLSINATRINQDSVTSDANSHLPAGAPRLINVFFPRTFFRAVGGLSPGYNPTRVTPDSFDYPTGSRGDMANLRAQQWLPYSPTFPVLLDSLTNNKRYVRVLRIRGEAE